MYEDRAEDKDFVVETYQTIPKGSHDGQPPGGTYFLPNPSFRTRYEVRSTSVNGFSDWHSFSHYKRDAGRNAGPGKVHIVGPKHYDNPSQPWWFEVDVDAGALWNSVPFGFMDAPFTGQPLMYSIQDGELIIPPPLDLDLLLGRAARHILPTIKSELSAVNSIIELKDFLSLRNSFRKGVSLLRNAPALIGRRHGATRKTARELRQTASDWYLQYSFNLAPLISDVKGVYNSFRSYQRKAARLVSEAEKTRTRHWTIPIDGGSGYDEVSDPVTLPFGIEDQRYEGRMRRRTELVSAKFHVEIQYSFWFTEWQKQHAAILALLDRLGINLNPAIVWNALPWSFVVDWVYNVSNALDQFAIENLEPVITIHRSLWSITRTRRINTALDVTGHLRGIPVSNVSETAYRRSLFTMTQHSIESSGLSLKELSLGGALIGSRNLHRKHR